MLNAPFSTLTLAYFCIKHKYPFIGHLTIGVCEEKAFMQIKVSVKCSGIMHNFGHSQFGLVRQLGTKCVQVF